jgi:hypothetical protein
MAGPLLPSTAQNDVAVQVTSLLNMLLGQDDPGTRAVAKLLRGLLARPEPENPAA